MRTAPRLAALTLVCAAVLTGCLKVEMSVTLNEDDTASGEYVMAVSREVADLMGEDELESAFETDDIEGATSEPYEDEEFVGTRTTFDSVDIAEFGDETMSITRDGDDYVVTGTPASLDDQLGGTEIPDGATATLAVSFPGEVSEHNGTLDGTTVTWDLLDPPAEISARGAASEGGGGIPLVIILIVLGVMGIGIGIAIVLITSTKRKDPPSETSLEAEREAGILTHADAAESTDALGDESDPSSESADAVVESDDSVAEAAVDTDVAPEVEADAVTEPEPDATEDDAVATPEASVDDVAPSEDPLPDGVAVEAEAEFAGDAPTDSPVTEAQAADAAEHAHSPAEGVSPESEDVAGEPAADEDPADDGDTKSP
ncbi:hypothetical protein [Demequina sp. NBRC 110056]|uniref:LppM family (lipo)protein n=1 Tax=Demequina sp. NBRC 110056 TaxID=1570345 RepID=UPI0011800BD2|nr:hypothetical protein [Demequina sp. NBRC 110056]